jgi:hypothetical protein
MSEEKVKVFKLNDCDFWAAKNLPEAIADAASCMGLEQEEVADGARELTAAEMEEYDFVDENGQRLSSFQEQLEALVKNKVRFPCGFASTEW